VFSLNDYDPNSPDLAPTRVRVSRGPPWDDGQRNVATLTKLSPLHHCEQSENQGPSDSTLGDDLRVSAASAPNSQAILAACLKP
jgi:hypothetical protein